MPTFETTPRFERDWKYFVRQQQALFRKVVLEVFAPDLATADHLFRPGLPVKGMAAHPGVFEMTWAVVSDVNCTSVWSLWKRWSRATESRWGDTSLSTTRSRPRAPAVVRPLTAASAPRTSSQSSASRLRE
jgi:hypothetical protein